MARKIIIDCDPGIDDAVALCMALFDPRLEVVAVTAVPGVVSPDRAVRNVQAIIDQLDPPRFPRVGRGSALDTAPVVDTRSMHGDDGLGNAGFPVSQLHHQHTSEKIICDEVRAAPEEVTILTLGPLTNVARALARDPTLGASIDRIIIAGGTVSGIGDVTAAAEFNMHYDPAAARVVFHSAITKLLVPLDVTRQVVLTFDLLEQLPDESTRAGHFLHRILPFLFRAYRQELGQESIFLHAAVALLAAVERELFETRDLAGDVEVSGQLTTGATILDRRAHPDARPNLEVATDLDANAARDALVRLLAAAGEQT